MEAVPGAQTRARLVWVAVGALLVALVVRLPPILMTDFPLGDGGLTAVMLKEVAAHHLLLPATTGYNGSAIPFAYPPLGLEVGAIFLMLGAPAVEILRWLPLVVNCLTVLAFVGLAQETLGRGRAATVAALVFPTLPFSWLWVIKGAGLPRSFGFLFFVLTAWLAHRLFSERRRALVLPTAAVLAGAVLSHPETGLFAAATVVLFMVLGCRTRWGLAATGVVAMVSLLLTAPWWVVVLGHHGVAPFLAANTTEHRTVANLTGLLLFVVTGEPYIKVFNVLALVGVFGELARRRPLLPLWAASAFLLVPRSAHTPLAVIVALLAGVTLGDLLPAGFRTASGSRGEHAEPAEARRTSTAWIALVVFLLAQALLRVGLEQSAAPPDVLSAADRQAMAWVARSTSAGSRFLVVSPAVNWSDDLPAEWFPCLAKRRSVATPQGLEWVPGPAFEHTTKAAQMLIRCKQQGLACLDVWRRVTGLGFDGVYVTTHGSGPVPPTPLLRSLAESPSWRAAFRTDGVTVFLHAHQTR